MLSASACAKALQAMHARQHVFTQFARTVAAATLPPLETASMVAARWLLAPVWAAQLFTAAKTCDRNPILGSQRLNRRGLHVWRGRLAHRLAAARRRRLERLVDPADRGAFARDGVVTRPAFLPPALFEQVKAEVAGLQAPARETVEGETLTRLIRLTPRLLRSMPACRRMLALPAWTGLLRYVSSFDAEPNVFVQTLFFRTAPGKRDHQMQLHMDTFHPTMKAWLFLEDVAADAGPFTYAPGSHRRTPRRDAWERRMSVDAADPSTPSRGGSFRIGPHQLRRIGCRAPEPLATPANTLVVADTYGFHARGEAPAGTLRIAIYVTSRPNPFLPWTRLLPRPQLDWLELLTAWIAPRRRGDRRLVTGPLSPAQPWS